MRPLCRHAARCLESARESRGPGGVMKNLRDATPAQHTYKTSDEACRRGRAQTLAAMRGTVWRGADRGTASVAMPAPPLLFLRIAAAAVQTDAGQTASISMAPLVPHLYYGSGTPFATISPARFSHRRCAAERCAAGCGPW